MTLSITGNCNVAFPCPQEANCVCLHHESASDWDFPSLPGNSSVNQNDFDALLLNFPTVHHQSQYPVSIICFCDQHTVSHHSASFATMSECLSLSARNTFSLVRITPIKLISFPWCCSSPQSPDCGKWWYIVTLSHGATQLPKRSHRP